MDRSRGATIALLGVVLFASTMVVGAVTAPPRDVAGVSSPTPTTTPIDTAGTPIASPGDNGTITSPTDSPTPTPADPRTLVGMQGEWVGAGSAFMLSDTDKVWKETSADSYFEVSMLDDGTVLAAFANEDAEDCGNLSTPQCGRTGYRHIDPGADGGPKIISEYSFPVKSMTNSEVHAVDKIGPEEYVFTDMDQERIVVVENGTEVWEWRASQEYEAPEDPTSRDWLHINDVDQIEPGKFLVSVRNANQIVVVERGKGVIETINKDRGSDASTCTKNDRRLYDADDDGDIQCGDPSIMHAQHNPQWVRPGVVMVADSENDRVIELQRTENGTWELAWVVHDIDGLGSLRWPRDADRLPNGHTLITDSLGKRIIEVDEKGDYVWSKGTNKIPYEADRLPAGEFAGRYLGPNGTDTPTSEPGTDNRTSTATPENVTTLPSVGDPDDVENVRGNEIPGLSLAMAGLRGTFSWIPYWFVEFHLTVTALSVGLVLGGGVDHWWQHRD